MPGDCIEAVRFIRSSSPTRFDCCFMVSNKCVFYILLVSVLSELQQQQRRERVLHLVLPKATRRRRRSAFHHRQLSGGAVSLECELQRWRPFGQREQELGGQEQEIEQPPELWLQLRVTGAQVEPEQISRARRYHRYVVHRPVLHKPLSAR